MAKKISQWTPCLVSAWKEKWEELEYWNIGAVRLPYSDMMFIFSLKYVSCCDKNFVRALLNFPVLPEILTFCYRDIQLIGCRTLCCTIQGYRAHNFNSASYHTLDWLFEITCSITFWIVLHSFLLPNTNIMQSL